LWRAATVDVEMSGACFKPVLLHERKIDRLALACAHSKSKNNGQKPKLMTVHA
jgi:hypothetical protein